MHALSVLQGDLNQPAHYLTMGPVSISVGNLVVILLIIALFVLAIVIPFPKGKDRS